MLKLRDAGSKLVSLIVQVIWQRKRKRRSQRDASDSLRYVADQDSRTIPPAEGSFFTVHNSLCKRASLDHTNVVGISA